MKTGRRQIATLDATQKKHIRAVQGAKQTTGPRLPAAVLQAVSEAPRWKSMLGELPQLVWATDTSGRCIYVNETFEAFTGCSAEKLLNESWTSFLHPDDVAETTADWLHSVRHETVHQARYRIRRYDDTHRWMLARAVLVKSPVGDERYWVGTNTDVHELHEVIDAAHKSRALEQDFLRYVARDLRTPLGIMEVTAELALDHPDDKRRTAKYLRAILKNVDRLKMMLTDLLDDEPT